MIDQTLSPLKQLQSLPQSGRGLLLYHWDTDGVASAALMLNFFQEHKPEWKIDLMHPTIGNYFLVADEYAKIGAAKYDFIMSVDLNFELKTIEELEKLAPTVFVFDHHTQTRDIKRPGKQDTLFPGNSYLVNSVLENPLNVTAVLGMIGDQEERLKERADFYPMVQEIMKQTSFDFDDLLHLTKLIDTNYITVDTAGLERMVRALREDPLRLFQDQALLDKERLIDGTLLKAQLEQGQELGAHGLEFTLKSELHLLSEYTRALSRRFPNKIVMVTQLHPTYANIYLRRRDLPFDLSPFVDLARSQGCNAGGKVEVAGLIIPLAQYPAFAEQVIAKLKTYGA